MKLLKIATLLIGATNAGFVDTSIYGEYDMEYEQRLSKTVVTAFKMMEPHIKGQPDKEVPKEKGKYLTAKNTGGAFTDGWYYNTTRTELDGKLHYLYMWKSVCSFTKMVPINQFLFSGQKYDPEKMNINNFGLIGVDMRCHWGSIGVLWKKPVKVT